MSSNSTAVHITETIRSACEACRRPKVKCSGERPGCARCIRLSAYIVCFKVSILAARVSKLEARTSADDAFDTAHSWTRKRQRHRSSTAIDHSALECPSPLEARSSIKSLSPKVSSFPSNAQLLQHMPGAYELPWITGELNITPIGRGERASLRQFSLPDKEIVDLLLHHFFHYTNSAYPIVHQPTFKAQLQSVSARHDSCTAADVCLVLFELAVSCMSLRRSSSLYPSWKSKDAHFYSEALTYLPRALDVMGLVRLQLLLMQLQYTMYNPQVGRVWDLSGSAMRAAVDLALHHEPVDDTFRTNYTVLELDMRRRLFWTAYCIDRNLCVTLGQPPGIADDWISAAVQLPLECDDALITSGGLLEGSAQATTKVSAIHQMRIRKLQSEIHHRLLSANASTPTSEWYDSMRQRLQEWRDAKPYSDGFCSALWADVNFHSTMVLLHRPSPANPSPGLQDLRRAFESAGRVMRGYKEMHRAGRINFDWLAMYTLFMAGITYLNSLLQAQRSGWTIVGSYVEALLDVHICTGLMEALAAVMPGTAGIRDAFESVSERIVRHLTVCALGTSRPATPPALQLNNSFTFNTAISAGLADPLPGFEFANDFGNFEHNALNPFLLIPLGQYTVEDWERALSSALENTHSGT